jgi:hypothetical protein
LNLFEILSGRRNHLKNQYPPQIFFFFGDLKKEYSADFIFEEKVANGENSPQKKTLP